ncbi:MAG: hypothetical protein ACRDXB_06490, partial [Actinomycetes bacterium]
IKTQSRIDAPGAFEQVPAGEVVIAGVAWAQTVGIEQVEVSIDGDQWVLAELAVEVNVNTWRMWKYSPPRLDPGPHLAVPRLVGGIPAPFDLNILPGIAVFLGGLILEPSTNRASGRMGAWLALIGGIWFTIGPVISQLWRTGEPGAPIGEPLGANWWQVLEQLGYFYGLGALVTALAAFALGRLTQGRNPTRGIRSNAASSPWEP